MTQQTATIQAEPQLSDLVDHLVQFDGPPEQFLLHLLAVQCHVGSAEGGAIVRAGSTPKPEILAVFPPSENETAPSWLAQAIEILPRSLNSKETVLTPLSVPDQLYGQGPEAYLVLIPLRGAAGVRGAAAFIVATRDAMFVQQCRQRLELTISLLSLYEMRLTVQARRGDLQRLRNALEVLAAVNELDRFKATAMAFCNELASTLSAERVSVGFHKGRYVRVEGMSHTERVVRKMELVQAIESAMEECLDQDVEVIHPAVPEATYVSRAAGELSARHGPTTICCLPLRRAGEPEGVLAVERSVDKPFTIEEIQILRLAGDLCTARLLELREHDKWIGAKAAGGMRKGLAALLGPRHTWVKAVVVGACAAIIYISLYPAEWRVQAPFEIQTVEHQVISAPFPGRIEKVFLDRNDRVVVVELDADAASVTALDNREVAESLRTVLTEHGAPLTSTASVSVQTGGGRWLIHDVDHENKEKSYVVQKLGDTMRISAVLVTMEKAELFSKLASAEARRKEFWARAKLAERDGKVAEQKIALRQVDQAVADIDLLQHNIAMAEICSRIDGVVVEGELMGSEGATFDQGDPMFRVATVDELRAELLVPEKRITDLLAAVEGDLDDGESQAADDAAPAKDGDLSAVAFPGYYLPFVVEDISDVAEVVEQRNVFRVRVRLLLDQIEDRPPWLRPGLEGVAKVHIGKATYAWLWTRDLVAWVRMKLWW